MLYLLLTLACTPSPAAIPTTEEADPPDDFPQLYCTKLEECTDALDPHPLAPDACRPEAAEVLETYPVCAADLESWLPVDQECADLFPDGQPMTPAQALDLWCEGPRE